MAIGKEQKARSPYVIINSPTRLSFLLTLDENDLIYAVINKAPIAEIPENYVFSERSIREKIDHPAREAGNKERKARLASLKDLGDIREIAARKRSDCVETVDQLKFLTQSYENGEGNSIFWTASQLRILLGRGKGNGILLDLCAAEEREILLSFQEMTKLDPVPDQHVNSAFGAPDDPDFSSIANVEGWLRTPCIKLGESLLSYGELIQLVADKIASHRDLKKGEIIPFLKEIGVGDITKLEDYFHRLSRFTIGVFQAHFETQAAPPPIG